SPTTWRWSTTSTSRPWRPPPRSASRSPAWRRPAPTPPSSPASPTCSSSGPPRRAGRRPCGPPGTSSTRIRRSVPSAAAPISGPLVRRCAGRTEMTLAMPEGIDPATLLEVAERVALEAGRLIVDERPRDLGVVETKSSATDVVTVMDQRSQDHLLARLGELRPEDGFAGEERGGRAGDSGITWVVDPIDGTVNYLYGVPAYAVSVAAVLGDPSSPGGWRPVAGAVVNPVTGERYTASLGGGAHRAIGEGEARRLQVGGPELGLALC